MSRIGAWVRWRRYRNERYPDEMGWLTARAKRTRELAARRANPDLYADDYGQDA
jgi:hypothetical protein